MAELPKYDAELSARLVLEARAADEVSHRDEPPCTCHNEHNVCGAEDCPAKQHRGAVVDAWIWKESNTGAMADQLEAAQHEIDRLKCDVVTVCNNLNQEQRDHSATSLTLRARAIELNDIASQVAPLLDEVERLRALIPTCDHCGERVGACFGRYEDVGDPHVACDMCCGHGNEDGWCVQLIDLPGWAATVARSAKTLRVERDRLQAQRDDVQAEHDRRVRLTEQVLNGDEYKLVIAQRDRYDATVAVMRPIVESLLRYKAKRPNTYAATIPPHIRELVDAYEARPVKP